MLTIKHIEDDGHETIMSAISVAYNAKDNQLVGIGSPGPNEGARMDGVIHYSTGRVYVMNDAGKTVSVYNLAK